MSIQKGTRLRVADNTGAVEIECFHIVGSTRKRRASIGDIIIASVKKSIPGGLAKKGDVVKAVVVRTKLETRRLDGTYIRFQDNSAVLIKDLQGEPRGSRIFGPIAREIRDNKKFVRIISLAKEVI